MAYRGRIFTPDPISDHELNEGLFAWLLGLPELSGGPNLFDLRGRYKGILTGGPGWVPGPPQVPGGFGAVSFDGTDDVLTAGTTAATVVAAAFWYYAPASPSGNPSVLVQGDDAFNSGVWDWGFYTGSAAQLVAHYNGSANLNIAVVAGAWNRIFLVRKAADGNAYVYVNAAEAASTVVSVGTLTNSKAVRTLSGSQRSQGKLGDIRLLSTTPTDPWAAAVDDYDQSRRGHPDTLRRVKPWSFGISAAAAPATDQYRFRFRNDDGSETTATWKAAENTDVSLAPETNVRLRVGIDTNVDVAATQYKLQYRKVGDTTWNDVLPE